MKCLISWIRDPWQVTNGGSLRVRAFAEALSALGHDVTCAFSGPEGGVSLPAGISRRGTNEDFVGVTEPGLLRRLKRELLPVPLGLPGKSMGSSLHDKTWDMCLTTELWLAQALPASGLLWIDHSDLQSEVARTAARRRHFPANLTARAQAVHLERIERRLSQSAKVVTTAGWSDQLTLSARTGMPVVWLPTAINQRPVAIPSATAPTLGMFADFAHLPNLDAIDVLRDWLRLGLAEGARVLLAGRGSDTLRAVPEGVEVLGRVSSPDDFYRQVDIALCPVRMGGGMKVKAVEALMAGRPVIVHPHVLEGFPPEVRARLISYEPGMRALGLTTAQANADNRIFNPFLRHSFRETIHEQLLALMPPA